jgi:hypothetical protein
LKINQKGITINKMALQMLLNALDIEAKSFMKTVCPVGWGRCSRNLLGLLVAAAGLLLPADAFAQAASPTNNLNGLILWWTFDENTGAVAHDSSGKGNNGALNGSPTWAAGRVTNAISFSGSSQYVASATQTAVLDGAGPFSVLCWIKASSPNANSAGGTVFASSTSYSYGFGTDPTEGWRFSFNGSSGAGLQVLTANVDDGNWHHIACEWDGTTQYIYVDGALNNYQVAAMGATYGGAFTVAYPGRYTGYYSGTIDDVRWYSRALSAAEVVNQYQWPTGGRTAPPPPEAPLTSASTHYIDYSAGSDTNDGRTINTPWQHHPYMAGWTGTYKHFAGDQFIFRGGVVWGNSCFPLTIAKGGSGSGVVDYYGVTNTWFAGPQWTRPVFDAGSSPIGTGNNNYFVYLSDNNITIDNIEMAHFYWNAANQAYGTSYIEVNTETNICIENCYLHSWSHDTLANGCQDNLKCIVGSTVGYNPGCVCSNCVFDGNPSGSDSGVAIYCFPALYNCGCSNLNCAFLPNGDPSIVSGCVIGWINPSFSGSHGAGIEPTGPTGTMYYYNNILHDCSEINIMLGGHTAMSGPAYVYNNIIYNSKPGCILLSCNASGMNTAYVCNNVLDSSQGGSYSILEESGSWAYLAEQNNLEITGTSSGTFAAWVQNHNLNISSSAAASYGFTPGNLYNSSSASRPTLGAGTNLTSLGILSSDIAGTARPQNANWDIGVYQSAYQALAAPTNLRVVGP